MPSLTHYPLTRIHPSSLIPTSEHNPDFLWLMGQRISHEMMDRIVSKVRAVVPMHTDTCPPRKAPTRSTLPSPPVTPTKPGFQAGVGRKGNHEDTGAGSLPPLERFLENIVNCSRIQAPTLLCTLVYLDRIQPKLPPLDPNVPNSRSPDVRHRVLLATIICASKYLNDSSPKNKHWAAYSHSMFHCEDVNAMELQMLEILGWELRLTEEECIRTFSTFLKKPSGRRPPYHPPSPPHEESAARANSASPKPDSSSQLAVPSNRRASRPARIDISTGPAHLHSSFSRSRVSDAPLSPPPSAAKGSFNVSQQPSVGEKTEHSSREEVGNGGQFRPGPTHRYATYSYGSESRERSSQGTRSFIPTRSTSIQLTRLTPLERPSADPVEKNGMDSTTSWPTLSRANGLLERVWGGSTQNGRDGVKPSRSTGGVFRVASSEGSGEQPGARV